jgi:hypothetical protein
MPAGVVFGSVDESPILNAAGQVAFISGLSGPGFNNSNSGGIWIVDKAGLPQQILRIGQQLEVAPGVFRTVADFRMAHDGGSDDVSFSSFNALGQVAFFATFTDNTTGLFVSAPAAPERSTSVLLIIAAGAWCFRRGQTASEETRPH